jgi:hypothetical protein
MPIHNLQGGAFYHKISFLFHVLLCCQTAAIIKYMKNQSVFSVINMNEMPTTVLFNKLPFFQFQFPKEESVFILCERLLRS